MKRKSSVLFGLALFLCLQMPAMAYQSVGTWRGDNGTVFQIHPSFQIGVYYNNGTSNWGRGWWLREGATFNFTVPGYGTYYAELVTNDLMRVSWNTGATYMHRIGSRGDGDSEPPPDEGWFTTLPDSAVID